MAASWESRGRALVRKDRANGQVEGWPRSSVKCAL